MLVKIFMTGALFFFFSCLLLLPFKGAGDKDAPFVLVVSLILSLVVTMSSLFLLLLNLIWSVT